MSRINKTELVSKIASIASSYFAAQLLDRFAHEVPEGEFDESSVFFQIRSDPAAKNAVILELLVLLPGGFLAKTEMTAESIARSFLQLSQIVSLRLEDDPAGTRVAFALTSGGTLLLVAQPDARGALRKLVNSICNRMIERAANV